MPTPIQKKSRNLNLRIAKSHQLAGQMVGMQLSIANVLALVVSAASIVAGATMLAVQQFPSGWPLWLAAAGIGTGLAILIEGLTLGGLIRIRVAGREIRKIDAHLGEERDTRLKGLAFPDPAHPDYQVRKKRYHDVRKVITRDYQHTRRQQTRQARRDRRNSLLQATGGCIASMCGGGLFYHAILGALGQVVSVLLSVVFTLAVTGTFISSEVFKDLQEQAIREAFANGNLAEGAMRQETRMQSLWAVYDQTQQFFQSPDALRVITEGGKLLVTSILADLHQDLRRSLAPEEQATPDIGPAIPPAAPIASRLATPTLNVGHVEAGYATGGAMQELGVGSNRAPVPCAIAIADDKQPGDLSAEAIQTMSQRVTLLLADSSQRKGAGYKELDAIGRDLLSLLERVDPGEREDLLRLAQRSPSEVALTLQKRYPDYARFFTEERSMSIVHIIARPDTEGATSHTHTDAQAPSGQHTDQHQAAGYDPQQHAPQEAGYHLVTRQHESPLSEEGSIQKPDRDLKSPEAATLEEEQQDQQRQQPRKDPRDHRERIKAVMRQTQKSTAFPSYRQIARSAGVGYSTVKKYARTIREEIRDEDR